MHLIALQEARKFLVTNPATKRAILIQFRIRILVVLLLHETLNTLLIRISIAYIQSFSPFLFQEIAKHLLAQTGGNLELALDHVNAARLGVGDVVNGGLAQPPAPSSLGFGVQQQQHPVVVRKSSQVRNSMSYYLCKKKFHMGFEIM